MPLSRPARARWIIRLTIVMVLLCILLAFGLLAMNPTPAMTEQRAIAMLQQVYVDMPLSQVKEILGPPHLEEEPGRKLAWDFTSESLNAYCGVRMTLTFKDGKVVERGMAVSTMTPDMVWLNRWNRLRQWLG